MIDFTTIPTDELKTYIRRCEVFGCTDHEHYTQACTELERREPTK